MNQVLRHSSLKHLLLFCGGLLFVGFSLGCMSFSIGGRTQVVPPPSDSTTRDDGVQRGKAFVPAGQEMTVYYPTPYSSTPNLEFDESDSKRNFQIVDQKPDHFRVKNLSPWSADVPWKARGITVTAARATESAPAASAQTASQPAPEKATGAARLP
jgi:hypothetical protein